MPDTLELKRQQIAARRRRIERERRQRMYRRRRLVAAMLVLACAFFVGMGVHWVFGTDYVDGRAVVSSEQTASASDTSGTAAADGRVATSRDAASPIPQPRTIAVPKGNGKFTAFNVPGPDSKRSGRTVTYTVETEGGINADGPALAKAVQATLAAAKGWEPAQAVHFVHLTQAKLKAGQRPDVRVLFASQATVDTLCAPLKTEGKVSCANEHKAVLNYYRWVNGVTYYGKDLAGYRTYMVNHEVGHLLGYNHAKCPGKGKPAPVMMQQTLGLDGCKPYPWPQ